MRFVIDVREACRARRTGKGQWVLGFVSELLKRENELLLLTDRALPSAWKSSRAICWYSSGGALWHLRAWWMLKKLTGDCIYIAPTSFIVPALLPRRVQSVPVVHDLIAFRSEPHSARARILERIFLPLALRKARHICALSENTARDLRARFPAIKQHVTPIFAGPMRKQPPRPSWEGSAVLCIGTLSPRKNQLNLLRAYRTLPDDLRSRHPLVLAGARGWQDAQILRELDTICGAQWAGHVDDDTYEALLQECAILALPSLYEGFGLQVLDALQRGIPVLLSDRGSLREVAGEAAVYVDPMDVFAISAGITQLLSDAELRKRLHMLGPEQAKRFSWQRTVDLFLEALHHR
ncbi:hypothetical protein COU80_03985 [Candidatus Peregrinibacteria bacterium CG10_big_fil_rev_8_21_14_0_10_55_24]|nr:MAG: hypothetical protein COU80_03985 [Candidatus Peregrinibacteria bacterium CG10_big_fil_rev_8_21_14_0_10_55_24]